MEFSWNYDSTMRALATSSGCVTLQTPVDARNAYGYSLMLKFDFNGNGEVPIFAFDELSRYFLQPQEEEIDTFVLPLYAIDYHKEAAGAETILKYFIRASDGRLNKAVTPKGEIYYGNNGLVLDEDLNPLLLSTVDVSFNSETRRLEKHEYIIHLTPRVFTDDNKMLNKSLAKKGIAYYLSHNSSGTTWVNAGSPYKVVIDDCSDYFMKAHKPNVNSSTNRELNKVLKDNIDEVLRQVTDDVGRGL